MADREDPLVVFKFHVEMKGIIEASFTECAGLSVKRDPFTYQEGGVNDYVHKLPGAKTEYTNITLKRGATSSRKFWDWFQQGLVDGRVQRVDMSILHLDQMGEVVKRWNLYDAFPVKWTSPDLKSDGSQVAIEALEITYRWLELAP